MCGIIGINWNDKDLIGNLVSLLHRRGPDDRGVFVDNRLSLGHTRLSIIDLSDAGHQPMLDETKEYAIVYNGEVYNYKELRTRLISKGYSFQSNSDTEVVLKSFLEWGERCVQKFIGMFAFAIYDMKREQIFLARDHMGIKPLYYYLDDNNFVFSSMITPILKTGISTEPNRSLIRDLLLYNITDHTNETFFKNILRFPKGHYGFFDLNNNDLHIEKWWDTKYTGDYGGTKDDAAKVLRSLLKTSVKRRLISDVPVGTCLSGGIDSSSIACLIDDSKTNEIKTFSAVFPGFSKDESNYIDAVNKEKGIENLQIQPTGESLHNDLMDFISAIEEPVPGPAPYSQFKVFEKTTETDTIVLLDGQGSDEIFAGYHYFFGYYLKGLLGKKKMGTFLKELGILAKDMSSLGMKSFAFLKMSDERKRKYHLDRSNISKELYEDKETDYFAEFYSKKDLHSILEFRIDRKLEHLLTWEDKNSMYHSRESRVPFLDIDLMEFVFTLPEDYIIKNGYTKKVLRDSMRGIVPDEILDRKDKIGFATPEDDWLREEGLSGLLKEWFVDNEPICLEYIDIEKTKKCIDEHLEKKSEHGRMIWRTLFLEAWFKNFKEYLVA